ncbi:related to NFU-1 protein (iron homeostasis) [Cephalotrichum gorgonifer]|uniref:Related to NFU-1 protein (Iron homeostasis) n=1 Tax=Cephalotrichum gorgonifer TaxID=2041049 RepID=A0AAE8SRS6_9PEZI|nr:related to NFU-1 protein (iron homeostasis) [Cephalotrichum gorgonifer]
MASRAAPRSALSLLARRTRFAPSTGMTPTKAALAVPSRQIHTILRKTPIACTQSRPRISSRATPALPGSLAAGARTIFIQTEPTPNADAVKFVPNHRVIPETIGAPFIEYLSPRNTISPPYPSPLAASLMNIDGVTSVFYGSDFITVTKNPETNWAHIRPEIFALITEAITSGQAIVTASEAKEGSQGAPVEEDTLAYDENDSEVVGMIKELLETRIRPSIQEDGGDIDYLGFEDGYVRLKLRGACRTCDSSTVTLKNGIEGMLMHYIEEVKGVHQVLDPAEEVAAAEFAKFEEKLKQQRQAESGTSTDAAAP